MIVTASLMREQMERPSCVAATPVLRAAQMRGSVRRGSSSVSLDALASVEMRCSLPERSVMVWTMTAMAS